MAGNSRASRRKFRRENCFLRVLEGSLSILAVTPKMFLTCLYCGLLVSLLKMREAQICYNCDSLGRLDLELEEEKKQRVVWVQGIEGKFAFSVANTENIDIYNIVRLSGCGGKLPKNSRERSLNLFRIARR